MCGMTEAGKTVAAERNEDNPIAWGTSEVLTWLRGLGKNLRQYEEAFLDDGVDGTVLFAYDDEDFKEMGIQKRHIKRLRIEINKLRPKPERATVV